MKYDIILCGVGGQGVLSVAAIIARAAMMSGLEVRQSEVHGMAQRGGAVQADLRISDGPIPGDLIAKGRADMILSMEPLESLRYVDFLSEKGSVVTSDHCEINIPDYPEKQAIFSSISSFGRALTIPADALALTAGSARSANMVLVGAASFHLPIEFSTMEEAVRERFASKGELVVETNLKALSLGRDVAEAGSRRRSG